VPGFVSHSVFITATWIAAICGGIGIVAAFVSAIVGYQLTENALVEKDIQISAARNEAMIEVAKSNAIAKAAEEETAKTKLQLAQEIERNTERGLLKQQYEAIQSLKGKISEINLRWSPAADAAFFAKDIEIAFRQADITVHHIDAPKDFWFTGIDVWEPGYAAGEGPVFKALSAAQLVTSSSLPPMKDGPPTVSVGVKPGGLKYSSYSRSGYWDEKGFHPSD
jgi:hypothetical protein